MQWWSFDQAAKSMKIQRKIEETFNKKQRKIKAKYIENQSKIDQKIDQK